MKGVKKRYKVAAKSPGAGDPERSGVAAVRGLLKCSEAAEERSGWNCCPPKVIAPYVTKPFYFDG